MLPDENDQGSIYIKDLQNQGFLEDEIQGLSPDDCVLISNHNGVYYYEYHDAEELTEDGDYFCEVHSIIKTITLDASTNGGTVNGKDTHTIRGTSGEIVTLPDASKSGYTFVGWNTNQNATTSQEKGQYRIPENSTTLYAIFMKPSITYALTTNGNGGSGTARTSDCTISSVYNNAPQATSCTTTLPSNSFTRSGYSFNGWSTSSSASSGSSAGTTVTLSRDTTYYATWKTLKPSCTITASGGSKKTVNNNPWYYSGSPTITLNTTNTSSYTFYDVDGNRIYSKTDSLNYDVEKGTYTATVRSSAGYSSTCSLSVSRDTTPPKIYAAINNPNYIVDYDQYGVTHYGQYEYSINENLSGGSYPSSRIMFRVVAVDFINPFAYLPTEAEGTGGYGSGLKSPLKIVVDGVTSNVTGPSHYDRSSSHRNYLGSYRIDYYKKFSGRGKHTVKATATDALGNSRTITITVTSR